MTTVEQLRSALTHPRSQDVSIAGVPWPAYKLVALILGLAVFGLIAVVTADPGPAVLTATAVATAVWIVFGLRRHER